MLRRHHTWLGFLLLAGALAGCRSVASEANGAGLSPADRGVQTAAAVTISAQVEITQEETIVAGEGINNPLVKQARQDLSARLGINLDAVTLVQAEPVVWPDASLGCPRPDMGYKQVPQDGMRIIFKAQGQVFEYHSGGSRPPFLCESPAPTPPGTGSAGEGT